MLDAVKLAMRITDEAYDTELASLITAAIRDLANKGVQVDTNDELIRRAIITYCRLNFGSPADYDKLAASYDMQVVQLMHATGYTSYGGCEQ